MSREIARKLEGTFEELRNEFSENIERELQLIFVELEASARLRPLLGYYVFPKGKRVRPLLALMLCYDLGGDATPLAAAAATLELIHAASLVHDDLPALDNDDFRRGRPSCHKAFDEGAALLSGDFLITLPFKVLSSLAISPVKRVKLIELLSRSFMLVCEGQALDLGLSAQHQLSDIHKLKTGSLFAAACGFAAINCDLSEPQTDLAQELGSNIGTTFQIIDDYIDRYGSVEERGRPHSSDARNNKNTYFSGAKEQGLLALNQALKSVDCSFAQLSSALDRPELKFSATRALVQSFLACLK